jgi:3-oxoacyl-[acyl-carrier protein] reductase
MIQTARKQYGPIDVLVNNAYFAFQVSQLHELSRDEFHRASEHELRAFHNCIQACLPDMMAKKSGETIVVSTRLRNSRCPKWALTLLRNRRSNRWPTPWR